MTKDRQKTKIDLLPPKKALPRDLVKNLELGIGKKL